MTDSVAPWPELGQSFTSGEATIAWDSWGELTDRGSLVLCHGFSGSAYDFALHVDGLSGSRQVLALDHRGHGRSSKFGRLDAYSLELMVADLARWLEAAASPPVHLLGHSMGGRIVLELALARPELAASLVLMDTSDGAFAAAGSPEAQMMSGFLAVFDPTGGMPDPTLMRGPEDDLIDAVAPEDYRTRRLEIARSFDPYALKALGLELFALGDNSLAARLGEIACPTTVVVGELDGALATRAPEMAAAIAGGELAVIAGAYHSPQLTHPAEWRQVVEAHLVGASS